MRLSVPQCIAHPHFAGSEATSARAIWSNHGQKLAIALGSVFAAMGCSVATEQRVEEADKSTHAFVKIQQIESVDGVTRGDALAGFLRLPSEADPGPILELAGLDQRVPPAGTCELRSAPSEWEGAELEGAELVEAERVQLRTEDGDHELAPHAFPAVADLLRGVVYASRDRSGEDLPPGHTYHISGNSIGSDGGLGGQDIEASISSPTTPAAVFVNGLPFRETSVVAPADVIDFSWERSACEENVAQCESDLLLIAVQTDDAHWTCAFNDSEEFGSVPLVTVDGQSLAIEGQDAIVSVHRLRETHRWSEDAELSLNFDFAIEASWQFSSEPDDEEPPPQPHL